MKKILLVIAILVLGGCENVKGMLDGNVKKTWNVINVNCPYVLGGRNGKTRLFYSYSSRCEEIEVEWTIEAGAFEYYFFPPRVTLK